MWGSPRHLTEIRAGNGFQTRARSIKPPDSRVSRPARNRTVPSPPQCARQRRTEPPHRRRIERVFANLRLCAVRSGQPPHDSPIGFARVAYSARFASSSRGGRRFVRAIRRRRASASVDGGVERPRVRPHRIARSRHVDGHHCRRHRRPAGRIRTLTATPLPPAH